MDRVTLSQFIRDSMPRLLQEWDAYATTCIPAASDLDATALRDHAAELLAWVADDMEDPQTAAEQRSKSLGTRLRTSLMDTPAERHAVLRVAGKFTIDQIVGEFRALRASVLRMRAESLPTITRADVEEMTRFDEAIDQMLSESVARFAMLAEETLRRESVNKDRFLAVLSHELRNPLNAITAVSAALDAGSGDNRVLREILKRQMRHFKRLLDDLLDLSRIAMNRISLNIESVDVKTCIEDALTASKEAVERKADTVTFQSPNHPVVIEADCTRVTQMITNLVNNAAKYSPAGSRIEVTLRYDGHAAEICVKDNGRGITADEVPHLFEPFHVDGERRRDLSGLGIGLWLTRTLAELHGGRITVESNGRGTGAEFCIMLPGRISSASV
ncbi:MAG: sensor histidine kinase [Rhodospirillaceae bacterium]